MKEVIDFLKRYFKAEHEANVAALTDKNESAALKKIAALKKFYGAGQSEITRMEELTDVEEDKASRAMERKLFMVKEFAPSKDHVFQAVASDMYRLSDAGVGFFASFFVKKVGDDWKIFSRANVCNACHATGSLKGKPCPECSGVGWRNRGGEKLDLAKLGKPVKVEKIEAPTIERFKAAWAAA